MISFPLHKPITFLVFTLALASCNQKEGPQCGEATAHFIALVESEVSKSGDQEQATITRANLPTLQNALMKACTEEKWDKSSLHCILNAKNSADTKQCAPTTK